MSGDLGGVFILGLVVGALLGLISGYVAGSIAAKRMWKPIADGYKRLWRDHAR